MNIAKRSLKWTAWVLGFILAPPESGFNSNTVILTNKQTNKQEKATFLATAGKHLLWRACVSEDTSFDAASQKWWLCSERVMNCWMLSGRLLLSQQPPLRLRSSVSDCIPIPLSWHHGQSKHKLTLPVPFTHKLYSFYYVQSFALLEFLAYKILDMNEFSNHVTIKWAVMHRRPAGLHFLKAS